MDIDLGLDALGLSYDDETEVAADAARTGFGRLWTGSSGDPFQTCALRWAATRSATPGGIGTAIGIVPVALRSPADLAQSGAVLSRLTGGRFVLGIGAGSAYQADYRRAWGVEQRSSLALMRAYLTTVHAFLAGDRVTFRGAGVTYEDAQLPGEPSNTPLYLGATGPEMTRLGGELADGIYLSWCTRDSITDARRHIEEGAARVGRDPSQVSLAASFRVSVDDSVPVARAALAASLLPYVLGWGGELPLAYRAHFARMGFAAEVAEIDELRSRGVAREEIVEAFPERMLRGLGYFGPAAGALDAMRRQIGDADIGVVRMLPARRGTEAIHAIIEACRPL